MSQAVHDGTMAEKQGWQPSFYRCYKPAPVSVPEAVLDFQEKLNEKSWFKELHKPRLITHLSQSNHPQPIPTMHY